MRKPHGVVDRFPINPKWVVLLLVIPLLALFLLLIGALGPLKPHSPSDLGRASGALRPPKPPRLAYLISGTQGDGGRLKRLLQAAYHPWNFYLLHLDLTAPPDERADLAAYAASEATFVQFGNVRMVEDADPVSQKGPTMIACTLHAVAILLREFEDWSWYERARPIIVDPGFYKPSRTDIFWAKEKRSMPSAFKIFAASPSQGLSYRSVQVYQYLIGMLEDEVTPSLPAGEQGVVSSPHGKTRWRLVLKLEDEAASRPRPPTQEN
ncbi:hypothetical protein GW17_00039547 [Ensete ventricosum]|nr:hypothetical protein GW17_00039547 [Ensete ventricosum]